MRRRLRAAMPALLSEVPGAAVPLAHPRRGGCGVSTYRGHAERGRCQVPWLPHPVHTCPACTPVVPRMRHAIEWLARPMRRAGAPHRKRVRPAPSTVAQHVHTARTVGAFRRRLAATMRAARAGVPTGMRLGHAYMVLYARALAVIDSDLVRGGFSSRLPGRFELERPSCRSSAEQPVLAAGFLACRGVLVARRHMAPVFRQSGSALHQSAYRSRTA